MPAMKKKEVVAPAVQDAHKAKIGTGHRARKLSHARVFADLKASGKTPKEIAILLKG